MIKSVLLTIALLVATPGFSHQEKDTLVLQTDTTQLKEIRAFSSDLSQKYQGPEFNYNRKDGEARNFLAQFLNWIFKGLNRVFGINLSPDLLMIIEYVIYVLLGILALYLLVRFITGEQLSSMFSKKATLLTDLQLAEEHIVNVDLEALIAAAVKEGNFRLAIRYHYLNALKQLSLKNIIQWHYEKTNNDYLKEIAQEPLKPLFKEVSYLYDYIWYGEQDIDETKYLMATSRFKVLYNTIPQHRG